MHITSGACGAGEMLDPALQGLAQDAGDADYFALEHAVPESSHTVEIEYVFEHEPPPDEPQRAPGAAPPAKRSRRPVKRAADDESEPELTNLTWLQNITNIMQVPQFPLAPVSPGPPRAPPPQNTRLHKFNQTLAKCQQDFAEHRAEYRADSDKKPPYSYSTLICMAMRCNNDKMTLSAIYSWIRDNFKYYRNADPTWQNSIRHNLSLNKVFVKVARSKHEPGKGGFWKLELGHLEGGQRISNRPHKKKRVRGARQHEPSGEPSSEPSDEAREVASAVDALPELGLEALEAAALGVAANVIVEPAEPPPLLAEDDLSALLLAAPDWEDLQLDCIDNYLDTCFK